MTNGQIVNGYQFDRRLGSGASGEVWLARPVAGGVEKAVRILYRAVDEEAARAELLALDVIKTLRHPCLLATEDYWTADHRLHVVMELADDTAKGRLRECLRQGLPGIPRPELHALLTEAATGIDFLHAHNVVHRNVKPGNILIVRGHAKVGDFGLARRHDAVMAQLSAFTGSPAYMAPEVWGGESGRASDLYSLAITYAELRQGRVPVSLGPVVQIMSAHMDGKFEFDPCVTGGERAALRKALARNPADRYESCAAFLSAVG